MNLNKIKRYCKQAVHSVMLWAVFVILTGLTISVFGFIELQNYTKAQLYIAKENAVRSDAEQLQTNLSISLDGLDRVATIYQAVGDITSQQLQDNFLAESNYQQGMIGIAWVPKVAGIDAREFERKLVAEGNAGAQIYALTGHGAKKEIDHKQVYFPVRAVYPSLTTEMRLGLDISSIPSRKSVMQRAARMRQVAITGRISLYMNDQYRYGFYAFYPVFTNNEGYKSLLGYVVGLYDYSDLLSTNASEADWTLTLHDSGSSSEQLLYSTSEQHASVSDVLGTQQHHWNLPLKVADKQWMLTVFPEKGESLSQNSTPYIWLLSGTLLTSLLALYLVVSMNKMRQVSDLTYHLEVQQALKLQADKANQAKTNLVQAASHDLRQPLHTITLLAGLIKQSTDNDEQKKLVERIIPAVKAMQTMFTTLLDSSQLDSGHININKTSFDLYKLLEKLFFHFELDAEQKQIDLRLAYTSAKVNTDPVLLERMLSNLISNAIRYAADGKVLIGCRKKANAVRIYVLDNGIGMSEQTLANITDEFYRADEAKQLSDKGLGLGLSIVSKLASLLELSFNYTSQQGKGSCFYIDVPYSDTGANELVQEDRLATTLDLHVLLIEDDFDVANAMSDLLGSWRCEVKHIATREEMQQLISEELKVDCILADYQLNHDTGLELVDLYQQKRPSVPVLIVSATEGLELSDHGFDYLLKPIEPIKLNQWLQQLILKD
jgi:signal transduction histidine kinase